MTAADDGGDGLAAVERFLHAYWAGDVDGAIAASTPDFVWINLALPKQRLEGHDQLRLLMVDAAGGFPEPIEPGTGGHRTVSAASSGELVLHERVDYWTLRGAHMELPCCAAWIVRGGLVAEWRDYYDIGAFIRQLDASGLSVDTSQWW